MHQGAPCTPTTAHVFCHTSLSAQTLVTRKGAESRCEADHALCEQVIKPQWEAAANGGLAIKRTGVILLEFAPANASQGGQAGYGSRSYDWNSKQVCAATS